MRLGVVFPQTEIGSDPTVIRDYAQAAEGAGYDHLLVFDHVLGGTLERFDALGRRPPYTDQSPFHEVFVLFGYLAACTQRLELVTGIVILPQRQTALVAKQAAEVDLLTGGRFRLGIGLGWNAVEYEALGQDFGRRGARMTEQVGLLRRLWTETSVSHEGQFDQVTGAGLAPMPVQRPIPLWFGAQSPRAYARTGALADGWFPQVRPGPDLEAAKRQVDDAARAAGRDPASLGMEGRVSWRPGNAERLAARARGWQDSGATHLSVNTMGAGLASVDGHLEALSEVAAALQLTSKKP